MVTNVKQLLEAANAAVPKITPDQANDMIEKGNTLVLDVRDAPEVAASGKVSGALNVSRGMLEFRADPELPYHDKNFDKDKAVILYCASGGRAALAGKLLKDMGTIRSITSAVSKIGPARWIRLKDLKIKPRRTRTPIRSIWDVQSSVWGSFRTKCRCPDMSGKCPGLLQSRLHYPVPFAGSSDLRASISSRTARLYRLLRVSSAICSPRARQSA